MSSNRPFQAIFGTSQIAFIILLVIIIDIVEAVDIPITILIDETIRNAQAIADLAKQEVLNFAPNVTFTYTLETSASCSTKPSDSKYINEFFQNYYSKNYRITIGPTCLANLIRFGNITAEFQSLEMNILTSYPFNHPTMIDLVTRSPRNLAENVIAIAKSFDWNQVAIAFCKECYSDDILASETYMDVITELLDDNSVTVRTTIDIAKSENRDSIYNKISILPTAARVVLLFLGNSLSDHVEFMAALQSRNYTRKEYLPVIVLSKYTSSYQYPWVTDSSKLDMFDKTVVIYNNYYSGKTNNFLSKLSFTNDDDMTVSFQFYESLWVLGKYLANAEVNSTKFNYVNPEKSLAKEVIEGPFGSIQFTEDGKRLSGYSMLLVTKNSTTGNNIQQLDNVAMQSTSCSSSPCLTFFANGTEYNAIKDIPLCGFNGEVCDQSTVIYSIVAIMAITICIVVLYVMCRKLIRGSKRRNMRNPWLIPVADVLFIDLTNTEGSQHLSIQSLQRKMEEKQQIQKSMVSLKSIATVDNMYCIVDKLMMKERIRFEKGEAAKLMKMKTALQHDNLNPFVGFSLDKATYLYTIWTQCFRGNLADIVLKSKDEFTGMDNNLQGAFVRDILKGLEYLHSNQGLGYHGALTSYNCVIDSHWILKLSGFGVNDFIVKWRKAGLVYTSDGTPVISSTQLHYYAPEIRRTWRVNPDESTTPAPTTPATTAKNEEPNGGLTSAVMRRADMYSFGAVLFEILFNKKIIDLEDSTNDPYRLIDEDHETIVPLYPEIPNDQDVHPDLISLLHRCFNGQPTERPDTSLARKITSSILKMSGSLVDQMMKNMESYTSGLEKMVESRTRQLAVEQERANNLLSQLLPQAVAEELKAGKRISAADYESTTILYSDIVGFTSLCSESEPMEVVELLSGMYEGFDRIITQQSGYKMETIGDAYCVAAGLPVPSITKHVRAVSLIALLQRDFLRHFEIPHRRGQYLKCRWGFNSGKVFSGVIGIRAPRYACFGATVLVAAKMESTGIPDNIQMTLRSQQLLEEYYPRFTVKPRPNGVKVDGVGYFLTYFLTGYEEGTTEADGLEDDEYCGEGPNLLKEYFKNVKEAKQLEKQKNAS
ncbi:unnamed protein product [Caenorhabditis angaria]|uniref:guanylate cyclase n=1 Tax=Caenorhabditis angaria TaxID=860376 RepID=A0A9P1IVU3_9PELO|nr:unnamed protein product [Caenorhabditis angaria]